MNNLPNPTGQRPLGPGSSSDGPWIQEEHQIPNGAQAGRLGPYKITLYKERDTHLRARACQLTCPGPLRMAVLRPPTCRGTSAPEDPPSSEDVRLVPGRASEKLSVVSISRNHLILLSSGVGCCQGFPLPSPPLAPTWSGWDGSGELGRRPKLQSG